MTPDIFRDYLLATAKTLEWSTKIEPNFTCDRFRGREDVSQIPLPKDASGIRLGDYPVLVASVTISDKESMATSLRALHNQMIIARSYMRAEEVINAHIMMYAEIIGPDVDVQGIIDQAERDETVCRKLIWVPEKDFIDTSYKHFIARTFLARPWMSVKAVLDAPLDHNQGLVERILVKHGLSSQIAAKWVQLISTHKDNPEEMISELVISRRQSK